MIKNIGFISTRFAGTDGVSLESNKWADHFNSNGIACYWFAGELERDPGDCFHVPEAHFLYEKNKWINSIIFGHKARNADITYAIHDLRSYLKTCLIEFIKRFDIHLLVAENVLSIPLHVPLGMALTEVIAETQIPTIAHHHDFSWERLRFSGNGVKDYLAMAFPPKLPNIEHVVICSDAQKELARRTGISSTIIPNVLDFKNSPKINHQKARAFQKSMGLTSADRLFLQPTRIIQRKGIEHAIELLHRLNDPRNKLVISHEAGDEGFEYVKWLKTQAYEKNVDMRIVTTPITDPWSKNGQRANINLWDVYPYAEFVTYPSLVEGFGNAFLEAIYFKKPVLINRYPTFVKDIEPHGFHVVAMDGYVSDNTVKAVKNIIESALLRRRMVNANYDIANRHFSYQVLGDSLDFLLKSSLPIRTKRHQAKGPISSKLKRQAVFPYSAGIYSQRNMRRRPSLQRKGH